MLTASTTQLTVRVPVGASTGTVNVQTTLGAAIGPVFTVVNEQDVGFSASPASVNVYQGASTMVSLNLTSTGTKDFTGLMQLSATGMPSGVTASFSPTHLVRGQSGTLILNAASSAALTANQDVAITAANISGGFLTSKTALIRVSVLASTNVTGVRGRFITPEGAGIALVRVAVQDASGSLIAQTQSDSAGAFVLTGISAGSVTLRLDATPANPLYPIWPYTFNHPGASIVQLPDWTIAPPPSDDKFTPINNAAADQVITDPRFPGLEIRLPAGVTITGYDGVRKNRLAVERLMPDKLPVSTPPFPMREAYQLYFGTPMGGIPSAPIPITLPNVAEAEPGELLDMWYFDGSPMSGTGDWKKAGLGQVSADGKTVTTLPNQGIPRFCGVCGLVSVSCPPRPNPPQPPPTCPRATGGNPVDLFTGQELPTSSGLSCSGLTPIDTGLTYNPVDAFGGAAGTFGSFGLGWTSDYDIAMLPFQGPQKRVVMPGRQLHR